MPSRSLILVLTLATVGCDDDDATGSADASAPDMAAPDMAPETGLPAGTVEYRLTFSYGAATADPDGGWTVTTDQGQVAHVREGWLASYSTQLVPCTDETARGWFIRRAWAGHGELDDPSIAALELREALHDPTDHVVRIDYTAEAATYCKAHYLSAQLTNDTPALVLRGEATIDGETVPFEVQTDFATGKLGTFEAPYDPTSAGTVIQVERDLGRLLDGMDLRAPSVEQLVFNMADATTLTRLE